MEELRIEGEVLRLLNTAGDLLAAGACFALVAALFYLARQYRIKKLSSVFVVFGVMFFSWGGRALFSAVLWHYPEGWVFACAATFRFLAAITVSLCAYVTFRCAARAFLMLRELALIERRLGEQVAAGRGRTPEGEVMRLVLDMRRMAQEALSLAPQTGKEGL